MKHLHITITDTGEEIAREMTDEEYQTLLNSAMRAVNEAPDANA